ncbi:TPA: AAA family ATPase [Pseudomonas aeruginosa]|uniref:trifunctional serine/threonine-protein kinase/ATP-binding protein/sensor histidine kinase n=1 Tax=Pseudomonas aeruginosa TaxID=287 RepID=UPI0005B98DB9|nr:AAA family ATPase [Pseudomonas aeruginosa]HBO1226629.1 AAA family ATPase [Pseudomonas aeruginosa]HDY6357290.1 AAA family ATPase [Pseudomonas aeruginosa]
MASKQKILWDDGERVFCRACHGSGGDISVLMVRPAAEHPLPATLERLAHEYSLRDELQSAWALRPQALHHEGGKTRLLLDDPGGEPLSCLLSQPLGTETCLRLAVEIAVALRHLHQSGLVHKDLKPNHIQVNCADGQARLTGFGLASRLPRERQAPEPPETIAGTLAYMAPEQTGRMNRSIDSRSDLYAFGVVLYQMLTGSLPFTASDPMEWVHCHIARKPPSPGERVADIPPMLSQIVLRLLAKTAEERYQSAAGVEHDLRRCLDEWQREGRIAPFTLDEQGTPDRLLVAEKLYGREREVEVLVEAFARIVASSTPELVLVSGYSGIGKSSVVNELHKVLVPPRGLFASGKFDQYKRDIPYSTLVQAFQGLVRTLLGKSGTVLEGWRSALLEALEPNARLITDLIPELRLIIGEQPPVPELEPQQAQHRFLLVFRRFIGVFARADHPLALFLDDLQWLDAATLDLLEDLLTNSELRHLMLVGAYRDNEVDASHPLMRKLQSIRQAGVRVDEIRLAPLARAHIEQLIAEALRCPPPSIVALARLVQDKTAGNPFFVIQFLQALAEEELLTYDHAARRWRWEPERIHAKGYTDNVVDLMVGKLARLPLETRQALQQLACLGNMAQIDTLATVLDLPPAKVHSILWSAVRQELVERLESTYAFAHDRIHEAAYSLIAEAARDEAHLRIGRLLAEQTPAERREEAIFEIVGQLNRGARLIEARAEREQLAKYNLLAGQRAKASNAYSSALAYLGVGAELLDGDCWERRHELCFALELNRAECEFLTGQLVQADERLTALTTRAATTVEQAAVACLQMDVCLLQDRSDRAVAVCLAYLQAVGIHWSAHPDDEQVRKEYQQIWTQLGERSIEQLIDLPPMEDAASLATLDALGKLFAPALQSDANLAGLTICKAVSLSLERGNCDASCMLYANVGRVAGRRFGDYEAGYRFGRLGCELVDLRGLNRHEARTYLCFSMFVARWMRPVRECRELLHRAFVAAHRVGDLAYAAYAGNGHIADVLFLGEPLAQVHEEAGQGLAYAQKVRFGLVVDFISTQLALIRTLRGQTPTFGCFDDELFDEARFEAHLDSTPGLALAAAKYWIRKLQARGMAGDHAAAMHCVARVKALLWAVESFTEEAEYHFHAALTLAATFDSIDAGEQPDRLQELVGHHGQLQEWARQCAESFACRVALVGAEIARVEGRLVDAELLYEEAIRQAQDNGFVQIEALANELAGHFYGARGLSKIARVYLQDARYGYLRWGADGKVRQLEGRHRYLRNEEPAPSPTATIATPVEHLDLATVLKVSQAASGEIVLEKLIDMVMRTAIEQAGAERGVLVLAEAGEPRIAAQATVGDGAMRLCNEPISAAALAETVLYQVLRTGESLCLEDAMADPGLTTDSYVRQHGARSILCMPLMNQAKLTGALYLENNLSAGVFSPARIAVLRLLASQAAISLENARLYRDAAEREAKIRRLVDANIIGIIVWSAGGKIAEANDAFLRMVGYERDDLLSGRVRWHDITPPESLALSRAHLATAMRTGRAQPFEKEYIRKDGSRVPVIVGLAAFEASLQEGVAFVLDLTERKQAEERVREGERRYREVQAELAHANRVATMGQLAASIAHEVNQPIAATVTNANAALRWLGAQPPELGEISQVLGRIIKDANRAAEVLGRIRQLIRKTPPQKQLVDINAALREMIEFTRGEAAKSGAVVRVELTDGLPEVEGDRVELQQVMLNLIVNALEAMGGMPAGERHLLVRTEREAEDVRVRVSDSGPGFAEGNAELLFAPFYTTKATGMGMGLSICRSIIDSHGGRLWASANQPRGAVVQFSLPAHPATGG